MSVLSISATLDYCDAEHNMGRFSNKVIVVTGAGKGIGRATAVAFAHAGASVAIGSRTLSELEAVKSEILKSISGAKVFAMVFDVSDEKSVSTFFDQTESALGSVDVLVNNAAILINKKIVDAQVSDWDKAMGVNVRGMFLTSRELFRRCEKNKKGGSIVNISSLAGIRGTDKFPGFSSYVASKFAVVGLTESLAVEGRTLGIRANCIAPGAVNTELLRREAPHLKTKTEPGDIAKNILFLADENESGSLSGSVIEVFSNIPG